MHLLMQIHQLWLRRGQMQQSRLLQSASHRTLLRSPYRSKCTRRRARLKVGIPNLLTTLSRKQAVSPAMLVPGAGSNGGRDQCKPGRVEVRMMLQPRHTPLLARQALRMDNGGTGGPGCGGSKQGRLGIPATLLWEVPSTPRSAILRHYRKGILPSMQLRDED